jgi:NAD(P)-dependent dehydrogenase (short-subunit alcohol dehydrogenase family)
MFEGRVALVTGAGSGIGRVTAELYAREGARVVVSDLDEIGGKETVETIRAGGGEAVFVSADVSKPEACERLIESTLEAFGRLDIACNNAGIGGESKPLAEYGVESWERVIVVNLSGVFYCMKYEIPAMLEAGGGSIVNMGSILSRVGFAGSPAYTSAKHGLLGLTETAALDYAEDGIRVNAVGPGFIRTPLIAGLLRQPEVERELISLHPIGRLGEPEEVAELVIWLSSDKASFITGSYYAVDGGYLAR